MDYLHGLDVATGAHRQAARLSTVLGAVVTREPGENAMVIRRPSSVSDYLAKIAREAPEDVPDGLRTVAGAAAGGIIAHRVMPGHELVGAIGGASLGRNIPALFHPDQRKLALGNLGSTGAAIAGSFIAGGSWGTRAVGFVLGLVAGNVATHYAGLR